MGSAKESLHDVIELLSDEEARQTLEFVQRLRKTGEISPTLRALAGDPIFRVPSEKPGGFRVVQPIEGKGVPASQLLVEDRR